MSPARWEVRLAEMDHSHGTTDRMRKAAMRAEIKELRAALKRANHRVEKSRDMTEAWKQAAKDAQAELFKTTWRNR